MSSTSKLYLSLSPQWRALLQDEFEKPYFEELMAFVDGAYSSSQVFPSKENVFRALNMCAPEDVKVVIIGQDPYHDVGQANGLCFSVNPGIKLPPSLRNIYKEIISDTGELERYSGDLTPWAEQGVLLLNAVLTVEAHKAGSHAKKGWEKFTDAVIAALAKNREGIVYMLWGAYAQGKCSLVDESKNLVLCAAHPSPLSSYRGFFGCKHFSKANEYLSKKIIF